VGFLEASALAHRLNDGRQLFDDVSFRVGPGNVVALVGDNGAGKTTLLRILGGELPTQRGTAQVQGGIAVMAQFIGSVRDGRTVRDLLLEVAPSDLRAAAAELDDVELALMDTDDEPTQMRYAGALTSWGEAGGYELEVLWDTVTVAALGVPFERARFRDVGALSGGEQKRLVLEVLLRGSEQVLLLDEPTTTSTCPANAGSRSG
jgi:ATPase subunit of ABC transporter with duplicated ATPase domains